MVFNVVWFAKQFFRNFGVLFLVPLSLAVPSAGPRNPPARRSRTPPSPSPPPAQEQLEHFAMQLLSSRASQRISSSLKLLRHAPPSPTSPAASPSSFVPRCCFAVLTLQTRSNLQKTQQQAIPGDFLRWAALGSCRTSRFATGFAPLEPKPLDSIMDVGRVKVRSAEEIASVWDDAKIATKS